jgi:hypothetical protein
MVADSSSPVANNKKRKDKDKEKDGGRDKKKKRHHSGSFEKVQPVKPKQQESMLAASSPDEFWERVDPIFAFPKHDSLKSIADEERENQVKGFPEMGKHFAMIWSEIDGVKDKQSDTEKEEKDEKKKKKSSVLLRKFRPKHDRQAADKVFRQQLKDMEGLLKPPKHFQSHGLALRLASALIPVTSSSIAASSGSGLRISVKKEGPTAPTAKAASLIESASSKAPAGQMGSQRTVDEKLRQELDSLGITIDTAFEIESRSDDLVSARIRAAQDEYVPLAEASFPARKNLATNAFLLSTHDLKLKAYDEADAELQKMYKKIAAGKKVSEEQMRHTLDRYNAAKAEFEKLPPIGQTGTNYISPPFSGIPRTDIGFLLPQN